MEDTKFKEIGEMLNTEAALDAALGEQIDYIALREELKHRKMQKDRKREQAKKKRMARKKSRR